jgi:hypothetical protein
VAVSARTGKKCRGESKASGKTDVESKSKKVKNKRAGGGICATPARLSLG